MAKAKGSPKSGGRKAGVPNKIGADVRALAQEYTPMALTRLAHIAEYSESDQASVSAIKELLDRGYGKAAATVNLDVPRGIKFIFERNAG